MKFFKAWPGVLDPTPATDDLAGEISSRAHRFCEPYLAANRAGWLLYPPLDFTLTWDGASIFAQLEGVEALLKLDRAFLPGCADHWEDRVPAEALELMPPFLEAFAERGVVQVWTGFYGVTEPEVSAWIRAPVNRRGDPACTIIEGVVETDWWAGPLFTNIEMLRTDEPVAFSRTRPWLQVIEVPRAVHARAPAPEVTQDLADVPGWLWQRLTENALRRNAGTPGTYRRKARRGSAA
ncbi:DUF6065 family protein [Salinarimonas sp.]|uniref:DUF6065 family protein n=1 Tax=Salinarimonas sp. TaxID=2766526 RepID=UPI0032D8C3AA